MRVTLAVNVIALVENLFLLKGKLSMNCPYCNHPMLPGFIQARSEVYFTQSPHKLLFAAKGNEILLPTWIQSHDSFENEPPFEYPLNPLFSNRYQHRKRSEPLTFISCPEHFLC